MNSIVCAEPKCKVEIGIYVIEDCVDEQMFNKYNDFKIKNF